MGERHRLRLGGGAGGEGDERDIALDRLCAGGLDQPVQLGARVGRVQRHRDPPGTQDSHVPGDPLRRDRIGKRNDAPALDVLRDARRRLVDLAEGQRLVADGHGDSVGLLLGHALREAVDGAVAARDLGRVPPPARAAPGFPIRHGAKINPCA